MEMLHSMAQKVFFPVCLLLSLHFSLHLLLGSAYTPPDKYFIDCGSSSNTTHTDRRVFVGDQKCCSAGKGQPVKNSSSSKDIYQTATIFREPSSYKVEINQNGTYMVRLHFQVFNTSSANLSDAVFNVYASNSTPKSQFPSSGFSLLTNFSIRNSTSPPVVEEFLLTIPEEGIFRLHFDPSDQDKPLAFVNAIEVFLLPDNFISDNATLVRDNSTYRGLLSQFLNKIHRINVGGDPVEQGDDKLWRNWVTDDGYLPNKTAAKNSTTYTREPNYKNQLSTRLSSEYIAPSLVYQTAKQLNTDINSSKVTWRFPVKKNAKHLVRTHFCDIVSNTANVLWFRLNLSSNFSQSINSYDQSNELATPFYFDFVVDSDNSGYMNISIGLLNDSVVKDAYLNGLEIMEVMKETVLIPKEREYKKNYLKVGSASVGAFLILIIVVVVLGFKFWKSDKDQSLGVLYGLSFNNRTERNSNPSLAPSLNLSLRISFGDIRKATQNFSSKNSIGEGGFGKVYKGTLSDKKVAVKRSRPGHGQGLHEFHTEIIVLSRIRHRHLVSLIGYCDERSEMILVYEFMEKGTLREHLYDSSDSNDSEKSCSRSELSWKQRLEICIGAANGIEYLHTGPSGGIIHRDLKSTNILLDGDYVAKVADFGLSKPGNIEPESMALKGTFGYLDPEYFTSGQFTEKSDVYAFGVVLLEVLCARPVINNLLPPEEMNLADWALHCQRKGLLEEIVDPMLVGKIKPSSLRKFFETAEKCLRVNSYERPTMHDVVYDLQYALLLQETAMHRDPNEDNTTTTTTTTSSSLLLQLPNMHDWHLPSNSMRIDEDD